MPPLSEKTPITPVRRQNTSLKTEINRPAATVPSTPIGCQLSELAKLDQIKSNYDQNEQLGKLDTQPIKATQSTSDKLSSTITCQPPAIKAYSNDVQLLNHGMISESSAVKLPAQVK